MLINHLLPFTPVVRLADRIVRDPDEVSLRHLRDVVAGRGHAHARAQAMELLLESDFPNKVRDYEQVLANEADTAEARYLAALYLSMVHSGEALDVLIAHTTVTDNYVLVGVLKALGRIGNAAALAAIEAVQRTATGAVAKQAASAASCIAHRLDLPGHDRAVAEIISGPLGDSSTADCPTRLRVTLAAPVDAEICLRSLARRPFAVELLEAPMYEMRCGRNVWMIALTREFVRPDAVEALSHRRSLLAIVARRDPGTGRYAAAFVVLTAPNPELNGANVLIHRADGDLAVAGHLRGGADAAEFAIRSLPGPRPFTIHIEGRLWPGRLEVTDAVTTRGDKQRPIELRWNAALTSR